MKDYKVGDTVVFVGKAPDYKHVAGVVQWNYWLENLIGKTATIKREKDECGDYFVRFAEEYEFYANEAWLTPQFKVGDRVIIHRPETEEGRSEQPGWMNYDMKRYDGNTYTISKILSNGHVMVHNDGDYNYHFHPRWLELVEDEPKKEKSKRSKFETLCMMAEHFDFGIYVEEYDVMAYIKTSFEDCARRTEKFRLYDSMESAYKNAYKWLLENALEMSESFKEWYNGRD